MKDNFVKDGLGWVDDFRALPGECGQILPRKIYAYALMQQGLSLGELKKMGFSKEIISEIFGMRLEEAFDENR